ncbi:MAG: hypothetical protein M3301_07860 [Chloroflexota bacterium]|nr:hypothetical protein [Chloroflexota bacterium]
MMRRQPDPGRCALAVSVSVVIALVGAGGALAGTYTVRACGSDRGNWSTQAFGEFGTRGTLIKRACNPTGPGQRGLVTASVRRPGRVARGARAFVSVAAPAGARFLRYQWAGDADRADCGYALQLYAEGPALSPQSIYKAPAGRRCRSHSQPLRVTLRGPQIKRDAKIPGATRIVQRIVCVGSPKRPSCSSRGANYISTFGAEITVYDVSPPSVNIDQRTPITTGGWVRGTQALPYVATDNVGVRFGRALIGGVRRVEQHRPCDEARVAPCDNGYSKIDVDTQSLPEGSQPLAVQAEDSAGNTATSATVTARIDHTAPGAVPVGVEGGQGWRNTNDYTVGWSNPDEGDRAPIAAAHYTLCRPGGRDCAPAGNRGGLGVDRIPNVSVPGPGEWELRMYREDQAGNQEPANASVPVTLRYDPEIPQLRFQGSSRSDPTHVSVAVTDKVSGLAGGQIELGRQASGAWQSLPTRREGNNLVAEIDDSRLPAGPYQLRARAWDQAGNQGFAERPGTVTLPLRVKSALSAGVPRRRVVRRLVRRRGKHRRARRRVTRYLRRAHVRLGRRVRLGGALRNSDGQPLAGQRVYVYSRSETAPERLAGTVTTDSRGRYGYIARGTSSRTLRFVYQGTRLMLPAQREVSLIVPAASTLRASPRRLLNGQRVVFRGRVLSLPVPAPGKLVELQVRIGRRWQTFRTARTDMRGNWHTAYRFARTRCGPRTCVVRYRFRARLPHEAGYPFGAGRSRKVGVRVRGG